MTFPVSHNKPPTHVGALTNDERWSYIVESCASLIAEGDRAAKGLPPATFRQLSEEDQATYRRPAMMAVQSVAYPGYVEDARHAAMHRAAEMWESDGNRPPSRWLSVRMWKAWAWGFTYLDSALDGTLTRREVVNRAGELRLLVAPSIAKERIQ